MIYGIGTDIVELSRVREIFDRYGDRFAHRILMDEELELYARTRDPVRFLAMRFAGKEATVKAMGTGFARGVWLRDVGVLNNDWGRPVIVWSERGSRVCARLGIGSGHLSLTDDAGLVLAFSVVEKAPGA
ncbi:MAG: holo-ACP synthase [Woeseiaceae bacterium]